MPQSHIKAMGSSNMMIKLRSIRSALATALLFGGVLAGGVAQATTQDFSFTGTFNQDDNVQLFHFTANGLSTVVLRTWSYAGGTNAAGQPIAQGGFDPILALFDGMGNYIDQNDDGGCGRVAADSVTGQCWDTYLSSTLAAGNYTVSIMEYDNFANGPNLSDGFEQDGRGNFTNGGNFFCNNGLPFCDAGGHTRENFWAFDVLGVEGATAQPPATNVPEPGSLGMLGFGSLVAGWLLWRRRRFA